jgi:copper resistance protein B
MLGAPSAFAAGTHAHGEEVFHRVTLEAETGGTQDGQVAAWDVDGWVGGDLHKLSLKSEGEAREGHLESAEFWALYSYNMAEFWDVQLGIRQDTQPDSISYLTVGVEGLAPWFLETEAHLFVSDEGDVSLRFHQETDILLTQEWILQPSLEASLFAQDSEDQHMGAGLAQTELGLQLRYEINRRVAPYVALRYERLWGETASLTAAHGESTDEGMAGVGVRVMF